MAAFTVINNGGLEIQARQPLLKADDYRQIVQAAQLIAQAQSAAQKILADAKAVYAREKARGYQDGAAEGKAAQAEKMMAAMIESVNYFSAVETRLVAIVMLAIKNILGEFDDVALTTGVVKQALDKVRNESKITLRVCTAHADTIRAQLKTITQNYTNIGFIDVVADSHIAPAACKVETEMGSVDTSVELQLAALRRALLSNFDSQEDAAE